MPRFRSSAMVAAALLAAIVAAMCGGESDPQGEPSSGEPIRFGTISDLSGPLQIGASAGTALKAYFEELNDRGGFEGHPLELVIADGGSEPEKAAVAARQLVDQDNVVGLIGSTVFADCLVNQAFYEAERLPVLIPVFDQACQESEVIFPITVSTAMIQLPAMKWAIETLRAERFAFVATDLPGTRDAATNLERFAEQNDVELVAQEFLPLTLSDPTGAMVRIAQEKPDVVLSLVDPPTTLALVDAADQQGVGIPDGVAWITPPGNYFPAFPSFGPSVEGIYVLEVNEPFEAKAPLVREIRDAVLAEDPDVMLDGFVPVGWTAGIVLEKVLEAVEGPLTRESLLEALRATPSVDPVTSPLPLEWGSLPRIQPAAARVLQVENGKFDLLSGWVKVKEVEGFE